MRHLRKVFWNSVGKNIWYFSLHHQLQKCCISCSFWGEGKTTYTFSVFWTPFLSNFHFSVEFRFACYQQVGRVLYVRGALRRTYTLFYPGPYVGHLYFKVWTCKWTKCKLYKKNFIKFCSVKFGPDRESLSETDTLAYSLDRQRQSKKSLTLAPFIIKLFRIVIKSLL